MNMKKQACSFLAIASLIAMFSVAPTQAQTNRLIAASVPFNFVIGDRTLPAGEYIFMLVQTGGSDTVKIQSTDGHITAFVLTRASRVKVSQAEPKLVFNRYADQYFLSQVHGLEESTTQQLARPRAEDRLVKMAAEKRNVSIAAHKR